MAILNYTTTVKAGKTVNEIQNTLAQHSAEFLSIEYGEPFRGSGRVPIALTFSMRLGEQSVSYRLPVRWEGTRRALRRAAPRYQTDEHAFRVAWRIIKDWVEAQVALIESEQAELGEVFLPYAILPNGRTAWEQFKAQKALAAPEVQAAITDLFLTFRVRRVSKPSDAKNDPHAIIRHVDIELRPDEPDPATSPSN